MCKTWCHKYSTRPLRPSRPWLQEVDPSVRCLQQVFLRAKSKPAFECEPHCLSLAATSSSLGLCTNMTSFIKPEIRNVSLRRQRRTEPRHREHAQKFGNDWTCSPKIWSRTDKHTDRHRQKDRQTRSWQYPPAVGGRVIIPTYCTVRWRCGGIFNGRFIRDSPLSPSLEGFRVSACNWHRNEQE